MTSQPDKLFRDKLANFQQPVPAGAWDRIESNLARPLHRRVWVRAAAGVALITAAAFLLWPSGKPGTEVAITTAEHTPVKKDTTRLHPGKKTDPKEDSPKQQGEPVAPPAPAKIATLAKTEKQSPDQPSLNTAHDSVLTVPETGKLMAETAQPEEKALPSTTLVYTADEVNSKFLKKKLPPEATPGNEEASGIQKLIGLAYAAKNSEAGLGDLRQKKDDILALNFGKKKGGN